MHKFVNLAKLYNNLSYMLSFLFELKLRKMVFFSIDFIYLLKRLTKEKFLI